jgi:hypothetical protein
VKEARQTKLSAENFDDRAIRSDAILNPSSAAAIEPGEKPTRVEDEADHHGDLDERPDELCAREH